MAKIRNTKRKRPVASKEQTSRRAEFVIDLITSRPSLGYDARIAEIMRSCACGKGAAEQAHALAKERLRDARIEHATKAIDEMTAISREREEMAHRRGDLRAANRIMMDRAKLLGLGAPDRVEITTQPVVPFDELSDEELAVFAKYDRKKED